MSHEGHDDSPAWTDEAWDAWKDYADTVDVQVRFKSWAGAEDNDERWQLSVDGAAWPKDWLSRQLIELAAADAENSCCGTGNYMLTATDRKTEWGASGAAYEVVLTLSDNLLSDATWVALGAVGQRLAARLKKEHGEWPSVTEPLLDEDVRNSATWAVLRAYDYVSYESLLVESVELLDKESAVAVVRHLETDRRYTVEVHGNGGPIHSTRLRKISDAS